MPTAKQPFTFSEMISSAALLFETPLCREYCRLPPGAAPGTLVKFPTEPPNNGKEFLKPENSYRVGVSRGVAATSWYTFAFQLPKIYSDIRDSVACVLLDTRECSGT